MKKTGFVCVLSLGLALSLAACGKAPAAPAAVESHAPLVESTTPPVETPTATAAPTRQDGERFESSIVIEGMEETVPMEHLVSTALGFEMDYDYERFQRYSDAESERFVSVWDDPAKPENYLELTRSAQDADTVAAQLGEELSKDYDITLVTRELEGAGSCIRIEASVLKGTNRMVDQLRAYYIIPARDGCRVAAAHAFIVESEGMWRRFSHMLDTLRLID